jgi:hypothetical protein
VAREQDRLAVDGGDAQLALGHLGLGEDVLQSATGRSKAWVSTPTPRA